MSTRASNGAWRCAPSPTQGPRAGFANVLLTRNRFEYLWQDNENYKRPTKMPAPAYIEQLMTWVQATIDNESVLPSKIGKSGLNQQRAREF